MSLNDMFTTENHLPTYILNESTATIYDWYGRHNGNDLSVYRNAAQTFQQAEYLNASTNWTEWLEIIGY